MQYSVGVIIGSLRKDSFNRQLAKLAMDVAPAELTFNELSIRDLPLYNADLDAQFTAPMVEFKKQIAEPDALLFVTPEYNRSVPGVLKNAIDIGSRPDNDNSWSGKPVGILGASNGRFGTITAQLDLRRILTHSNCLVMPQPQVLVSSVEKKLVDGAWEDKTRQVVEKYMASWAEWIARQ